MALRVIKPGMLTTVQDLGRWGQQNHGVPVAGPMDWYSHRLANRRVGNDERAAAVEITLIGPELEADADTTCVVTGAEFELTVSGVVADPRKPFVLPSGRRLRFGSRRTGARATLAVRGGFDLPSIFGSRATSVVAHMGPFGGRPLVAGDLLGVGDSNVPANQTGAPLPLPDGGARLRVLRGPDDGMFGDVAYDVLLRSRFVVTPHSNRMGYRLDGPPLPLAAAGEMLSSATPIGSLQVPGSGKPILLMADRQTTGGYPRIATVITADLPIAGQLAPGDWIEFETVTRDGAVEALRAREASLTGLLP
jgi:antagonist of KipI